MKECLIWLIILQICSSEYVDNRLQNEADFNKNPSLEYKAIMKNLCDNWQSPISYLKKRGYMPLANDVSNTEIKQPLENTAKHKRENYFFFPKEDKTRFKESASELEDEETTNSEEEKPNPESTEIALTEPPSEEAPSNNSTGIINKVKDKIFSIFSRKENKDGKDKPEFFHWDYDPEDSELFENSEFEKRLFVRSASEKPTKLPNDEAFINMSKHEIQFILSFIKWFKQNKYHLLNNTISSSEENSNQNLPGVNVTASNSIMSNDVNKTHETRLPQNETNIEGLPERTTSADTNIKSTTPECITSTKMASTTIKPTQKVETKNNTELSNGSKTMQKNGTKGKTDNITIDLNINQKNGSGEEIHLNDSCCNSIDSTLRVGSSSDNNKYLIKSKFLAHLHHMVDEVGKPPRKPLNLAKVQDVIDKCKYLSTVTMSDGKTTECAPLKLNDMSFDMEWNNMEPVTEKSRQKLDILDLPYVYQDLGIDANQFLQGVNPIIKSIEEYLQSPYADNFLDSQQSLPNDLGLGLKSSTKREALSPRLTRNSNTFSKDFSSDISPFSESSYDYDSDDDFEGSSKRRIKGRVRGKPKKKPRTKLKNEIIDKVPSDTANIDLVTLDGDEKSENDFNSFDELKDIQFRVNDDDEEAISRFISNLNSPPEVFSFDVDKYLRSAQLEMQPKNPDFEIPSPEPRTFYEFMQAPEIENERLPIIDTSSDPKYSPVLEKRAKTLPAKRDLLRQYIKGVSNALYHNLPELDEYNQEKKSQRSSNLDIDTSIRTNNLIDGFSTNLDAMNYIKSDNRDESLNDYFLLSDINPIESNDVARKDTNVPSNDYSPQSLEIDLDLNKKFRELGIRGAPAVDTKRNNDDEKEYEDERHIESNDQELESDSSE